MTVTVAVITRGIGTAHVVYFCGGSETSAIFE